MDMQTLTKQVESHSVIEDWKGVAEAQGAIINMQNADIKYLEGTNKRRENELFRAYCMIAALVVCIVIFSAS